MEHHGAHVDFAPLALHPAAPRPIRIFVGGYSAPALRRAATVADGWTGINPGVEELRSLLTDLDARRAAAGRTDQPFTVLTGVKGAVTEEAIAAVGKLGVDGLIVLPHQLVGRDERVYDLPLDAVLDRVPRLVEVAGNA